MGYRDLSKLKQNFNNLAELWVETVNADHIARDTPAGQNYHFRISQQVANDLRGALADLADYALGRSDYTTVPVRRTAIDYMIERGLEHPHADFTIKNATLTALQNISDNNGTVAITDAAIARMAAFPIAEGGDEGRLLQTQKTNLVCDLEGKTRPHHRAVRASRPAQAALIS